MSFLAAVHLLTSIPLPWWRGPGEREMARSAPYFPLVGLLIGLVLAGLNWLLRIIFPPAVTGALIVVAMVLVSGGMHLDGLADTTDGIAGHREPAERLRVMQDSRVGAFGVMGVVLALLVKYVALTAVPSALLMVTLLFLPVVSRWAMVCAIFQFPSARATGMGRVLKDGTRWGGFTVATALTLVLALVFIPLFGLTGLVAVLGVWLVATTMGAYLKSKLGGLTGDTYGAVSETAELTVLLLVLLMVRLGLA
ncbi:MAG: adenosylcobinamide-GDP ribazoletransferase [Chloroflexota bacterium]